MPSLKATVYLIGAGPGDAELLTCKALRLIQSADLVLYDSLIQPEVLDEISDSAERIFVGKRCGKHSMSQAEINALLLEKAQDYSLIVRLKGGDPFLFGRGGEELAELRKAGIRTEVVPGVTTASAAAAALQFPLTHRDLAPSVLFLSGHTSDPKTGHSGLPQLDWERLSDPRLTLVIYMGVRNRYLIAQKLLEAGRSPDTPVALLAQVSLPEEEVRLMSLRELAEDRGETPSPALLVIGEVLHFSKRLDAAPLLA